MACMFLIKKKILNKEVHYMYSPFNCIESQVPYYVFRLDLDKEGKY